MSSKTRTRTTRTTATTGTAPALRSVPDQPTTAAVRTDTEDKLWAALHTHPNSTAADLSAAATIGKSTAQKILVKWASDGSVTRTPGITAGGRRAADVWSITETDPSTVPDTATDTATDDERTVDDTAPADTTPNEPTTTPNNLDPANTTPAEENLAGSVDAEPTATLAPQDARDTTDVTDGSTPEKPEPGDGATSDNAPEKASGEKTADTADRLAPGALRGMVEDWLREHPDEQAGPTKIAKDLGGKSSGAVSNALDKLVADSVAVKTQDKPRRFALAPAQQEAAASPAH